MVNNDSLLQLTFGNIDQAIIDESGEFKYILINIEDPKTDQLMTLVRGASLEKFEYHKDIFKNFIKDEFTPINKQYDQKFIAKCPGGGWIKIEGNKLIIHDKSINYGPGDHELAKSIIQVSGKYKKFVIITE